MNHFPGGEPFPAGYVLTQDPFEADGLTVYALMERREARFDGKAERAFIVRIYEGDKLLRDARFVSDGRFSAAMAELEQLTDSLLEDIYAEFAPTVELGKREKLKDRIHKPELLAMLDRDPEEEVGSVLATRRAARALLWQWRNLDGDKPIRLDASNVEIATASFFHELRQAWPKAFIEGASEDVALSFYLTRRD